jgi:alpha/beta superfamily hydrolase
MVTTRGAAVEERFEVDGLALAAHVSRPATTASVPAVVLCHDFPTPPRGSLASGLTFPELADRIARDIGWMVFTFNFRGTGGSEGDFSVGGWLADQRMAVDYLSEREEVNGVWLVGTGAGGTLALITAARDKRVRGVATLGAQATLRGWDTSRFIDHCRRMGVLRTPGAPTDPAAFAKEIADVDALAAARRLAPRPLLVLHGSDDDVAPLDDARLIAEAHGDAELRTVMMAGRRVRHDPRAIASLFGWLDRQMH